MDSDGGESNAEELDSSSAPDVLRLKIAVSMFARGKTQRQIAAHFGRDERTVRRWLERARALNLAQSSDLIPQDAVAEVIEGIAERKAELLDLKHEAEAVGNFPARILCVRELLRVELAYVSALAKIGFFQAYCYTPDNAEHDPAVESADRLRKAAQTSLPRPSHSEMPE